MLKNYFKIAFRNLWKNKSATFINIFGLAIGLCSCLLIGIYLRNELSYDKFEQKGNRIARVIMEYKFDGGEESKKGNFTSVRVAPVFKQTFPEIEDAARMIQLTRVVQVEDKQINEKEFMFADASFFNLFSFKLLKGDQQTALKAPNQVILTQSTAKRYFADADPVGKIIKVGINNSLYQVTGVMPDCPSNSQIKFDFLASFSSLGITKEDEKRYWNANYTTYLLLKDENSFASLQTKITPFMQKEMQGEGASVNFYLEPFMSIHLHSEFDGFEPSNNIKYIYILEAVALLILIIACFTYINLNTSRSIERAKEVGVRKVIGAGKMQLFRQFIGESVILCTLSVIISLFAAILLLPAFNRLVEKDLPVSALISLPVIAGALVVALLVGLLAGSYPALILSNIQPVKVLKGSFKNTNSGTWVRKSLIVFQFAISVLLIVSTFIMQRQLSYIRNKNLGYNRDQVLVLPMDNKMLSSINVIKQEFKSDNNILSVSRCVSTPVSIEGGYNMRSAEMPDNRQIAVTANPIDEDYIKTTGLQLIAGTDLTEQDIKDSDHKDNKENIFHFVLNESAAKQLGWTAEQAIGKKMFLDDSRPGYVSGVVKDFHFESLHHAIKPVVLFSEISGRTLLLKLKGNDFPKTITTLESKWKTLVPHRPFEYRFLDDDFNKLYSSDQRLGKAMNIFSFIAIVLACLGLLGLSSYAAKQRVKEIGIRKVLGATVGSIATLLTIDFVKLVLIAILIASPVAWLVMNNWLSDFSYRIQISWWMVAGSAIIVVAIAIFTVGFQAIKASVANPVKSLRSE
ncbi:ABC transporter permease [Chitinophagaceae bacterium LWZ2-11]